MQKKALKLALLLGLVSLVVLTAGVVVSAAKKPIPEYVGSKACLGCHGDKWSSWASSGHATHMVAVNSPKDFPGDVNTAAPELKAELAKADFIIAGQRFLARDSSTGELKYLNVVWNQTTSAYEAFKGGSSWNTSCAGCHSTNYDKATGVPSEYSITCENCHGPGRDHIAGKGDTSKITLSLSSDVCGQCHGAGKMLDGTGWVVGYRPNMKLANVPGISLAYVDPEKIPAVSHGSQQYAQWATSSHGPKAIADLKANDHASGSCYKCHTTEAYQAANEGDGTPFTLDKNADYVAISCVLCHRPHGLGFSKEPAELCITCHTGDIPASGLKPGSSAHHPMKEFFGGYGAAGGLTSNGNVHKDLTCADCHMTEGNHMWKVIRPDDPGLADNRADTCTTCHKDSSKEVRAAYLEMWQGTTKDKIDALNADIAAIKAAGVTLTDAQKLKVDTAVTNISFITADGSEGAHNFDYATRLLSQAKKDVAEVKAAVVK